MNNNIHRIQEDEIDIKEIFSTIYRYKVMIILFVLIALIVSSYIAYFKPNVYKASATVEVGIERYGYMARQDMLSMAMSGDAANAETEMEIIRSRFLSQKAAQEVDVTHRYYTTRRFKEVELYKASPFQVGMLKGYGISFEFYPVNEKSYRLVVGKALDENGVEWSYDKVHEYGKEVDTEYFHLNIVRVKKAADSKYRFVVFDPKESGIIAQGGVSVQQLSKFSNILQISYEDNVALRAKEFADALARAYIQQNIENKTEEAERKLNFIEEQLKYITENLKSSAMRLEEFKRSSQTVELSAKAQKTIEQISEYESQLSMVSIQEELLNTLYEQIKSGKGLETISIANLSLSDPSLSAMIKKLQDTTIEKKLLSEDYTEMYPEIVKLTKMIEELKNGITSTVKNLKQSTKEKRELLENSIAKHRAVLEKLPADERMFGQLQRKFVVNEKIYSYLLEKRSETAMVKAATVSNNRVIDHALHPGGPIKPKRKLIVLVGLILGLIGGIAVAFLREFLDDRIKDEEEITKRTSLPLLGNIPHIQEGKESEIKVFNSPKSGVSEAFRNLRTNLQFMSFEKGSLVIATTSTISGEGKTTVSINLGAIMSMAGKKTIILNLDMRKPTLHERFGIELGQGLSSLLAGRAMLKDVIQSTQYENLDVITSGPIPPNPSELIQGQLMEKVLEKLKEVYDVIILDTPPIGLVTDARTLMTYADISLYIFRANLSKKDYIHNLEKITELNEIPGLGLVLNDVKSGTGSYGYGYGYGYGYYEEDKK
ncbi:polysaccharide biosynthesis tyrosine autokinase [Sulfurovum sp. zt1-1]|uniref:non-specific protein-tyrosine kinase n=1 Tax=Sulfurovum zhangzhouensis TaxID=3019067 RepID=A0ABT7QVW2_9BACT|nr:tyrosine-protein kinase [Sulfurovum zhangzhouensis]MDM5270970.1 polysaccharide biosynthesis tyrosine autokinase [Sulfurovum zhangzhouensis]